MTIRLLNSDVISRIAAGEVIERPASVVKELVENALDAEATHIIVEVTGGGTQLIRVTDNGCGIPANQVELAFSRHATSKITSDADLEFVATLGFRGEALPSIASVSDVTLNTRYRDETAGSVLRLAEGTVLNRTKQGRPHGTTLTIQNLFQNVPARLKFLKSTTTENSHISHMTTQYALAFPKTKFDLIINGRTVLRSPGNGVLRDTLVQVYGLQIAQSMLQIPPNETEGIIPAIEGFVSPPDVSRSNRTYLSFFVNHRWIQSRTLSYAVEQAYSGMLMTGKHPITVINIAIPAHEIDVNVHPAKTEIKFHRERDVFAAVQRAVRNTLVGLSSVPSMRPLLTHSTDPKTRQIPMTIPTPTLSHTTIPMPETPPQTHHQLPILRIIGQSQNSYIVAEGPDGIYLIDQHAAHERVLFEKVLAQQAQQSPEIQGLLEPMTIELTAVQQSLLASRSQVLSDAGFCLEPFGEGTGLLRAVPAILKEENITTALSEILDGLEEAPANQWSQHIAASLACHGAIRAGKVLSLREMEDLIQQLENAQAPRTCPHGRPTMIHLSTTQIEKEFGRR